MKTNHACDSLGDGISHQQDVGQNVSHLPTLVTIDNQATPFLSTTSNKMLGGESVLLKSYTSTDRL